jgi:hypothetical protein
MSHASRTAHLADLIDDLADLYLAQVTDLREFAEATEAGEGTLHLEQALRQREIRRDRELPGPRAERGLLVNPAALIPVTHPGDLRQDRVGQLVKRVLGRNPSRLQPRARNVPRVLRPGRESDPLGRAGRELPGLAGRGREVVLYGRGPSGGHLNL